MNPNKLYVSIFVTSFILFGICCNDETPTGNSTHSPGSAPSISSISISANPILQGEASRLKCYASDPDGDTLQYSWSASAGNFQNGINDLDMVWWIAPISDGTFRITATVSDPYSSESKSVNITVYEAQITSVQGYITNNLGNIVPIATICFDSDCINTDVNGHYLISSIAAGRKDVTITHNQHEPYATTRTLISAPNTFDFIIHRISHNP